MANFKSSELKRLREDLDELEVESQHFSKLIHDARKRFKDFLVAVDKINPFFIEMCIRNSFKPNHKRKDAAASSTPYRRLRHDSMDSSDENIPQRGSRKSMYRWSMYAGDHQDFERDCFPIHDTTGNALYSNDGDKSALPMVLDFGDPYTKKQNELAQRSNGGYEDSPKAIKGETRPCNGGGGQNGTYKLPLNRLDSMASYCSSKLSEKEVKDISCKLYSGLKRLSCGSSVDLYELYTSESRNRTHGNDLSKLHLSSQPHKHSTVLLDILNSDDVDSNNNTNKADGLIASETRGNLMTQSNKKRALGKKFILDYTLSDGIRNKIESPLLPVKSEPRKLIFGERENVQSSNQRNLKQKQISDMGNFVKEKLKPCNSAPEQRQLEKQDLTQSSESSNLSYSKDQRKRLKKKMRNAWKKPENCCFMGQV